MVKRFDTPAHQELLANLKEVRAEAINHARLARDLSRQRRHLIDTLLAEGFSQSDLARELGVTRQAIQKMVAAGSD
ncbi:TrfB-related DNA-binding protein [Kribbella sp. NPDC026611]|uniref:TrfB-related DNA-binding protein n=1 Tax=Kribbella sp. NPDC026611 TaxID=3154911 RepID=UPI0033EFAEBC